nr:hypothetical protein GCM10020093_088620 [Planobispora longispora]
MQGEGRVVGVAAVVAAEGRAEVRLVERRAEPDAQRQVGVGEEVLAQRDQVRAPAQPPVERLVRVPGRRVVDDERVRPQLADPPVQLVRGDARACRYARSSPASAETSAG